MKKTVKGAYKVLAVMFVIVCLTTMVFGIETTLEKKAVSSKDTFVLDGKEVIFDLAYNIENSNYIQLRSVAAILSGTPSQFNVYWDNDLRKVIIETGVAYTGEKPKSAETKEEYSLGEVFITENC